MNEEMIDLWVLREVRMTSPGPHTELIMMWLPEVDPLTRNQERSAP
jgi:hypothetical protein